MAGSLPCLDRIDPSPSNELTILKTSLKNVRPGRCYTSTTTITSGGGAGAGAGEGEGGSRQRSLAYMCGGQQPAAGMLASCNYQTFI